MFSTESLAYKIRNNKLKKHSEQFNKWLAGFIDSDGSISLHIKKHSNDRYSVYLQISVNQSASNDPDFELLRSIAFYYGLGSIYYDGRETLIKRSHSASWMLNSVDSQKLLNLVGKHLLIKATHADNLVWLVNELKGYSVDKRCIEEIREFSKCSREHSSWRHIPKHPPWAWVAGYLDGDGHYRCRLNRERYRKESGYSKTNNELKLFVGSSLSDSFILNFLHLHFKGSIRDRKDGVRFWQRSLGKGSYKFATEFIPKMLKYSCIEKKYATLQKMLDFHATRRD